MLEADPQDLLVAVKDSPHWRVTIRPLAFDANRIPKLPDCWNIIEPCAVSLRGWDFPHVDRKARANGSDWIASWCAFMDVREYWRFFQSGQFLHLSSFREDSDPAKLKIAIEKILGGEQPKIRPSGCVDVTELLFRVTEIYEFSARLAQRMEVVGSISVAIELNGVKSRILTSLPFERAWWQYCPSLENSLKHSRDLAIEELVGRSSDLALDATVWFCHRFQWNDPNLAQLKIDQQRLLTRNL
jgi:hypothetical protein